MPQLREHFWNAAHAILLSDEEWTLRCQAVRELIDAHDHGKALVHASGLPNVDDTWVAPPLPTEIHGYRCFLKQWDAGEETGIHGHPNTMFVYVISATIESTGFQRSGDTVIPHRVEEFGPQDIMTGCADNNEYDNFIHQLRCTKPGWSLHMYSDSGSRGLRFESSVPQE